MFELMNDIKDTYVMQLPSARDEAALNSWEYEMKRFKEKLEVFYDVKITEEDIKKGYRTKKIRKGKQYLNFLN